MPPLHTFGSCVRSEINKKPTYVPSFPVPDKRRVWLLLSPHLGLPFGQSDPPFQIIHFSSLGLSFLFTYFGALQFLEELAPELQTLFFFFARLSPTPIGPVLRPIPFLSDPSVHQSGTSVRYVIFFPVIVAQFPPPPGGNF